MSVASMFVQVKHHIHMRWHNHLNTHRHRRESRIISEIVQLFTVEVREDTLQQHTHLPVGARTSRTTGAKRVALTRFDTHA